MENYEIKTTGLADMSEDELMHYGRKGMKWGQHIFGSVKAAKTKRKRKKNLEKARQAKVEKQKAEAERKAKLKAGKLKPKDMTTDELKDFIARRKLEEEYKSLNRQQWSKGKSFAARVANNMLVPAAEDVGRQLAKSGMVFVANKALGLDEKPDYKAYANNKKK